MPKASAPGPHQRNEQRKLKNPPKQSSFGGFLSISRFLRSQPRRLGLGLAARARPLAEDREENLQQSLGSRIQQQRLIHLRHLPRRSNAQRVQRQVVHLARTSLVRLKHPF